MSRNKPNERRYEQISANRRCRNGETIHPSRKRHKIREEDEEKTGKTLKNERMYEGMMQGTRFGKYVTIESTVVPERRTAEPKNVGENKRSKHPTHLVITVLTLPGIKIVKLF